MKIYIKNSLPQVLSFFQDSFAGSYELISFEQIDEIDLDASGHIILNFESDKKLFEKLKKKVGEGFHFALYADSFDKKTLIAHQRSKKAAHYYLNAPLNKSFVANLLALHIEEPEQKTNLMGEEFIANVSERSIKASEAIDTIFRTVLPDLYENESKILEADRPADLPLQELELPSLSTEGTPAETEMEEFEDISLLDPIDEELESDQTIKIDFEQEQVFPSDEDLEYPDSKKLESNLSELDLTQSSVTLNELVKDELSEEKDFVLDDLETMDLGSENEVEELVDLSEGEEMGEKAEESSIAIDLGEGTDLELEVGGSSSEPSMEELSLDSDLGGDLDLGADDLSLSLDTQSDLGADLDLEADLEMGGELDLEDDSLSLDEIETEPAEELVALEENLEAETQKPNELQMEDLGIEFSENTHTETAVTELKELRLDSIPSPAGEFTSENMGEELDESLSFNVGEEKEDSLNVEIESGDVSFAAEEVIEEELVAQDDQMTESNIEDLREEEVAVDELTTVAAESYDEKLEQIDEIMEAPEDDLPEPVQISEQPIGHNDEQILLLSETIKVLRQERENLEKRVSELERDQLLDRKNVYLYKSQLDEKSIENNILEKRYEKKLSRLKDELEASQHKQSLLEEQNKVVYQQVEEEKAKNNIDINKIRKREIELENKLEMLKSDTQAQLKNREERILQLKRRIDTLEFDIGCMQKEELKVTSKKNMLEEKLDSVIDTLRSAISDIESSSQTDLAIAELAERIKKTNNG